MDRAQQAGVDDNGIGVLFGLYDWRVEVMGLLYHTIHLEETFNGVGPHTISFPRTTPATGTPFSEHPEYAVSDADFKKLVAVLRLSVPYTGMICTAREPERVRKEVIPFGVSQIDAGTRIGVGAYVKSKSANALPEHEQFSIGDDRSLDGVVKEICDMSFIPSFCTACYRAGRTGEQFMKVAKSNSYIITVSRTPSLRLRNICWTMLRMRQSKKARNPQKPYGTVRASRLKQNT
jgi:2-iminoacetate synthase